jgi:hypothetical protein
MGGGVASPVEEALKLLGLGTPFIYAAGTYGFFHYLDTQASAKAKKAIAGWLKPLEYDRAAVAAAMVEIFDRLYTRPLLGWRAAMRSAAFTIILTSIFVYELCGGDLRLIMRVLADWDIVTVQLLTNLVSDYLSLFFVRGFLVIGGNRPIVALVGGSLLGMCVVVLFGYARQVAVMIILVPLFLKIQDLLWYAAISFVYADEKLFSLPALAVHLWLPLFGFGLLCVHGLNYALRAVGGMQWFLKRGNDHPLDAVGYVLAAIVFVATAAARLF